MDNTKSYSTEDIEKLKQRIATYRDSLTKLKTGLSVEDLFTVKENFNASQTQVFHVENLNKTKKQLNGDTVMTTDVQEQENHVAPLVKNVKPVSDEKEKTETPSYAQMKQLTNRIQRPDIPNNLSSTPIHHTQQQPTQNRPIAKLTFPHIDAFPNRTNNEQYTKPTITRTSKTKRPNVNIAIPINKIETDDPFENPPVNIETGLKVEEEIEGNHEIMEPTTEKKTDYFINPPEDTVTKVKIEKEFEGNDEIVEPTTKKTTDYFINPPEDIVTKVDVEKEIEDNDEIVEPINETTIEQSHENDFFSRFNIFRKRKKE